VGNHRVQRVALDMGYESAAAFNRAFKRRCEVPPALYRRDFRERTRPKHQTARAL
jgi:transcriptional regulator GlxA family with amidase domain